MGVGDDGGAGEERSKLGGEAKRVKARGFFSGAGSSPPAMGTVTLWSTTLVQPDLHLAPSMRTVCISGF